MLRTSLLSSLALITATISVSASSQDNGGGPTGGMGSSYPVVKLANEATPSDGAGSRDNASRQSTDGSGIRGGSFHHRIAPDKAVAKVSATATGATNLSAIKGGTAVVNGNGAAIGIVTGRATNSNGLTVGLQVKLTNGTTAVIPATKIAMLGSTLTTTYVGTQ